MIRQPEGDDPEEHEQDWLKTNLAKFSKMLQGQKSLETVSSRSSCPS